MDSDPAVLVARTVRAAMDERGVTEVSLAAATGIPLATLRHRLTGRSTFAIDELDAVAVQLGTRASALIERSLRYAQQRRDRRG